MLRIIFHHCFLQVSASEFIKPEKVIPVFFSEPEVIKSNQFSIYMFKETELKVQSMIKIVQCHVPVCYVSSHAALVHNVSYFTSACFSGFRSNCCSV